VVPRWTSSLPTLACHTKGLIGTLPNSNVTVRV
jgi:hypothetical protein